MGAESDDVEVTGGGYRRPWWLYGVVGLVVLGIAVAVGVRLSGPSGPTSGSASASASASAAASAGASSSATPPEGQPNPGTSYAPAAPGPTGGRLPRVTTCAVDLPAPAFRGVGRRAGSGLNRWDCAALEDGPSAWVLRDADSGSFGHHGAVVTFPIDGNRPDLTLPGERQGLGWWTRHQVVVRIGERYAQVRGDVGHDRLAAIARGLRLVGGRLRVPAPRGLERVRGPVPYRSPLTREIRYGDAVEAEQLGGLVYAGVSNGAEFEDELYVAIQARPGGRVRGHPAVFSAVGGGNLTLAWEPRPGLVAFVGYSGGLPDASTKRALHRLAQRLELVHGCEWRKHVARVDDVSAGS